MSYPVHKYAMFQHCQVAVWAHLFTRILYLSTVMWWCGYICYTQVVYQLHNMMTQAHIFTGMVCSCSNIGMAYLFTRVLCPNTVMWRCRQTCYTCVMSQCCHMVESACQLIYMLLFLGARELKDDVRKENSMKRNT